MSSNARINFLLIGFFLIGILIASRLFYWQVLAAEELALVGEKQYWISFEIPAKRGEILAQDGFPLAANKEAFLIFASIPDLRQAPEKIAAKIAPFLVAEKDDSQEGKQGQLEETEEIIKERLNRQDLVWVPLKHRVSRETKKILENLEIEGIGFEEEQTRNYPEGSSAAHLLGFVGSDVNGQDKGYFGLEGYYDLELKGRPGVVRREKDASGKPILVGEISGQEQKDGRTLVTTIDRTVQFIIEEKLKAGLERYGAVSGSVTLMDPKTGAILGMISLPVYNPESFFDFNKELFPNPVIASSYEPGSTFKVLVMAAALDAEVVKPDTRCDQCSGPRQIADYSIKTYNNQYYPQSTMTEVIGHSDNVGMVFVTEKLGLEKSFFYLEKFGLGQPTGIDLEGEITPALRPKNQWRKIDLATVSFGQGIAATPLQMVRAVGAIANGGYLVKPFVVKKVIDKKGETEIFPRETEKVIKPSTARIMTEMMVNATEKAWFDQLKPKGFKIATKTGTAQIPIAGHYDEEKTIASCIGFAPADNSRFVMLVTLQEPTSSPWGANTAAPLWIEIAKELIVYYGIMPDL